MNLPLPMSYEAGGHGDVIDLAPLLDEMDEHDVRALMSMRTGMSFSDSPAGIQRICMDELDGDAPQTLIFRDQTLLLEALRRTHPLLWEAASGSALRCSETTDMFGAGA